MEPENYKRLSAFEKVFALIVCIFVLMVVALVILSNADGNSELVHIFQNVEGEFRQAFKFVFQFMKR